MPWLGMLLLLPRFAIAAAENTDIQILPFDHITDHNYDKYSRTPAVAASGMDGEDEEEVDDRETLDEGLECNWKQMMEYQGKVSLIERLLMSQYVEMMMIEAAEMCVLRGKCGEISMLKTSMPEDAIKFAMSDCKALELLEGSPGSTNRLCWGDLKLEGITFGAMKKEHEELTDVEIKPAIALCLPAKCTAEKLMKVQDSTVQIFKDVIETVEKKSYVVGKRGLNFTKWDCDVDHSKAAPPPSTGDATPESHDTHESGHDRPEGFSVMAVVLIAIIVGVVAGAGGYVVGGSGPRSQANSYSSHSVEMSHAGPDRNHSQPVL